MTKVVQERYAYRVTLHVFDRVPVEQFAVISTTPTEVTYYDSLRATRTQAKRGPAHRWFPDIEKASACARAEIDKRVGHYHDYIRTLQKSGDAIQELVEEIEAC